MTATTNEKKPTTLPVNLDDIPAELKAERRRVSWRLVKRGEKWTKIPLQIDSGRNARTNDSSTWAPFASAASRAARGRQDGVDGIGFILGGGFAGVDLDCCVNPETHAIEPWARDILSRFSTYAEISPSGTGVKVFCRGSLPDGITGRRKGRIEVYGAGRYFTVTGRPWNGAPAALADCSEALAALCEELSHGGEETAEPAAKSADSPQASDQEILDLARKAANGAKFSRLWSGDASGYPSHSEADQALACHLAFWTRDAAQIERMMRTSGLVREKWSREDYLSRTIARALETVTEFYEWEQPTKRRKTAQPTIFIGVDEFRVVDEAVAALAKRSDIFQRGGMLVEVVRGGNPPPGISRPKDAPRIAPIRLPRLRELLADSAVWLKPTDDEPQPTHPTEWAVRAVDARGQWPNIRRIEGLTEIPVLRADGTVLQQPGYDLNTGLLFEPQHEFPKIPARPTKADAERARDELLAVVVDFPFAAPTHRAAWVASVITPPARFAYYGPAPLFLVDANVRGCGKTLLLDAAGLIVTGRPMARMTAPRDDDEFRKRITALAVAGEPLILIDNMSGMLGSPSLDAALTATSWSDRLLGRTEMVTLPLLATWYATGNNVILVADTVRRIDHIRLESPEETPEERSGFQHPDLLAWVRENRMRLAAATVTMLAGYCAAGRPDMGLTPWGSFEGWSALVRQVVVWCGLPDPAATRRELATQADRDAAGLRMLLDGLEEMDPDGRGMTVATIVKRLAECTDEYDTLRSAIWETVPSREGKFPTSRSIGMKLHHLRKRVIGGRFLDSRPSRQGDVWYVSRIEKRGTSDTSGTSSTHNAGAHAHARTRAYATATGSSPASPTSPADNPPNYGEGVSFSGNLD